MYILEALSPSKTEILELNRILTNIIKRILMIPQSTPNEVLYMEAGILDVGTMIDRNKIKVICRLIESNNQLMTKTSEDETPGGWREKTAILLQKYNIQKEDLQQTRGKRAKTINQKILSYFNSKIEEQSK